MATAPEGGREPRGSPAARTTTRESANTRTTASHRQADLNLVGGRGSPQIAAKARVSARDRLVAETSTKMAPTMPNAAPPLSTAPSSTCRVCSGISIASVNLSLFEPRVAIRMSTGSTEVKNWAAMVIDRSNTSIRRNPAAARRNIRPGRLSSSHPSRRCNPNGRRPRAASARARAGSSTGSSAGSAAGPVWLSEDGVPSFESMPISFWRSLRLKLGRSGLLRPRLCVRLP